MASETFSAQFYTVSEGRARDGFRADPKRLDSFDYDALLRGDQVPERPVPFEKSRNTKGNRLYDWMSTGLVSIWLLSSRLIDLFRDAGLKGWSTFAVDLRDNRGEVVEGYSGLVVAGRCGPPEDSKCPVVTEISPWSGKPVLMRKGFHFEPTSWDGADFFLPSGTTLLIVTARVAELLEREKVKNVYVQSLAAMSRIVAPGTPLTPLQ